MNDYQEMMFQKLSILRRELERMREATPAVDRGIHRALDQVERSALVIQQRVNRKMRDGEPPHPPSA